MTRSIEVVRFRVGPEAAGRFVAERALADAELQGLSGYLGSELAQGENDKWMLIVQWASGAHARAAQNLTLTPPGLAATNAWIALASEILSFETLDVRYSQAPSSSSFF